MMRLPQRFELVRQLKVLVNRFAMTTDRHWEERNKVK